MCARQNNIKITSWNAQSIKCLEKKYELVNYIQDKKPSICVIQESYLKAADKVFVPNYKVLRQDRNSALGGGLCTIVDKRIKCERINLGPFKCIECLSIKLYVNNCAIILNNVYVPRWNKFFVEDLTKLCDQDNQLIIGDLNAICSEWSAGNGNQAGNALNNFLPYNGNILYAPSAPTHYAENRLDTTIDIAITNCQWFHDDVINNYHLISDHCAINCSVLLPEGVPSIISYTLDLKNAKWDVFKNELIGNVNNGFLNEINTVLDIENALSLIMNKIKVAQSNAIPVKIRNENEIKLSELTKNLLRLKCKYKKKVARAAIGLNKNHYKSLLKQTEQLLKVSVETDRAKNWCMAVEKSNGSAKKFWRLSKCLSKKRGMSQNFCDSDNRVILETNKEAAEAFASLFAKNHRVFTPNAKNVNFDRACNKLWDKIYRKKFTMNDGEKIDSDEILVHLHSLKNKKSTGHDDLNSTAIKRLPMEIVDMLVVIFNKCLELSYWPKVFKHAIVVPVPKGKVSNNIKNYRPISLLSVLSKVLEKCILKRIKKHVNLNNLLPNTQFGFRDAHSAPAQVTNLTAQLICNKKSKKSSAIASLDISKAFDATWHSGLIGRLHDMHFDTYIVKIIQSFISDRSFAVKVGNECSSLKQIPNGLPQGSSLSPLLYALYTANIPSIKATSIFSYADDTCLVESGKNGNSCVKKLNRSVAKVQKYFNKMHIKVNADKTNCVFVPCDRKRIRAPNIKPTFDNVEIEFADSFKYLGVYIDKKLLFDVHITHAKNKVLNTLRKLTGLHKPKVISRHHATLIIKQIIMPQALYAAASWATVSTTRKIELRRKISICAKLFLGLDRMHSTNDLYKSLNILLIEDIVNAAPHKMISQLESQNIRHLSELADRLKIVYDNPIFTRDVP